MNAYLEGRAVGMEASMLKVAGRNAGALLEDPDEPSKVLIKFECPLPAWVVGVVGVCTSCGGGFGTLWIVAVVGGVGAGGFEATPLDTSRTRPSSKVVTGVPLRSRRGFSTKGEVLRGGEATFS
jgi:hypothetical protein